MLCHTHSSSLILGGTYNPTNFSPVKLCVYCMCYTKFSSFQQDCDDDHCMPFYVGITIDGADFIIKCIELVMLLIEHFLYIIIMSQGPAIIRSYVLARGHGAGWFYLDIMFYCEIMPL